MAIITTTFIVGSCVVGAIGLAFGGYGIKKTISARKISKSVQERNNANLNSLKKSNIRACEEMDKLGETELRILQSFKHFANLLEKIHNRPQFTKINNNLQIPKFESKQLDEVAGGAELLLSGLVGSALGTAGGFAAAGATTAAVTALGTASTGTAISSLSGVAATNATLAALGGGSLAAGGGGMALGATVLGVTAAGAAILVGGIIFSFVGNNLEKKAHIAQQEMLDNEKKVKRLCVYLEQLYSVANAYLKTLIKVKKIYEQEILKFERIINEHGGGNISWNDCTKEEQLIIENNILIVTLLFSMCKVKITIKDNSSEGMNTINQAEVSDKIFQANQFITEYTKII